MKPKYINGDSWSWFTKYWDEIRLFHVEFGSNPFGIKFPPMTAKEYFDLKLKITKKEKENEK